MDALAFERDRLEFFRQNGFAGRSRWFEDRSGRKTYAIVRDDGSRPTLVVHGGLAEASVWCPIARYLPGTVILPDRPGHGLSDTIDYTGLDYQREAADWMLHLVDALGAREVDLVGNSMGGYFAIAFALAHPERVRRIALVGAPAGLDRELPLILRLPGRPVIGGFICRMMGGTKDAADLRKHVYASLCAHPERISDEALLLAARVRTRPGWDVTMRSMTNAVANLRGWRPELSIREATATLRAPTLFAWGDEDSFAPPSSGEELAARMRSARVEVIDDAGHIPMLDQPEAVAAAVTRFFAEESEDLARAAE